jgi:hypothetical protein
VGFAFLAWENPIRRYKTWRLRFAKAKLLHERDFAGKPVKSFKVYEDPFGENEICVELGFVAMGRLSLFV